MEQTTKTAEPKAPKARFSAIALRAIEEAQASHPGKDLSELVMEASAIYERLKKEGRTASGDVFSRSTALATVCKEWIAKGKPLNKEQIVEKADKLYLQKNPTGKTNLRETAFIYPHVVSTLRVFEVIK